MSVTYRSIDDVQGGNARPWGEEEKSNILERVTIFMVYCGSCVWCFRVFAAAAIAEANLKDDERG